MSPAPRLSVIVVSYRVRDLLRRCLASVRAQSGVEVEIFVVDNASDDGSADMVAREFPDVLLIRNQENAGFACANNQALQRASGDWLLLLNPDTELSPRALATLVEVFGRHPRAGAVGLALVGPDGISQPSCHSFPGLLNIALECTGLRRVGLRLGWGTATEASPPRGGEGEVDWVAGACLCVSRAAYVAVGGLEEALFLYGEEPDWCWRARQAGFRTIWSNGARVLHHGGASSADLPGPLFVRNLEARLRFLRVHRGAWRAVVGRELMTLGALARFLYWWVLVAAEGRRSTARTRQQLERFRAVIAWRLGRQP